MRPGRRGHLAALLVACVGFAAVLSVWHHHPAGSWILVAQGTSQNPRATTQQQCLACSLSHQHAPAPYSLSGATHAFQESTVARGAPPGLPDSSGRSTQAPRAPPARPLARA
ncbi:MAG: hypothetical protein ACE5HD_11905 [Acidobacteriota bacterium]